MIDGVTVVASRSVQQGSIIGIILAGLFLYGLSAGELFASSKLWPHLKGKVGQKLLIIAIVVFCFTASTVMTIDAYQEHKIVHTYYTVEVDDTASFNEFNRTYDIISYDEEANLYEVELKEATS